MSSKLQIPTAPHLKIDTPTESNTLKTFSITDSIKKIKRLRSIVGVQPLKGELMSDRTSNLCEYYLNQFLLEFSDDIRGDCLEFEQNCYAKQSGKQNINKHQIIYINENNPQTQAANVTKQLNDLPSDTFDCIICPYVLHTIFELKPAVSQLYRILKPNGVLLVSVPHISIRNHESEFWRFTSEGLQTLLEKDFGTQSVTIRAYGNSLTAAGVVRGLVADEFTNSELNYHDLRFAPVICARAIKTSAPKTNTVTTPAEESTIATTTTKGLREVLDKFLTPDIYSVLKKVNRFYRQLSLRLGAPIARRRLVLGLEPLSYILGYDRGPDIMRYHLQNQFLPEFAEDIRGHCLEFEENLYASWFEGDRVTKIDVLHVDNSNPRATLVADLTQPNNLPSNTFDCIICTYVLHVIFDVEKAVAELYRILKPGGVLLVAIPQVSIHDYAHEIWRFTPEGLELLLGRSFNQNVTIRAYGNSLLAAAAIRGLVVDEFTSSELDYSDPLFAPVVCARAVKQNPDTIVT